MLAQPTLRRRNTCPGGHDPTSFMVLAWHLGIGRHGARRGSSDVSLILNQAPRVLSLQNNGEQK